MYGGIEVIDRYVIQKLISNIPKKGKCMIRNDLPGEYMIKTRSDNDISVMNEMAFEILQLIDGKKTIEEIVYTISIEYSEVDIDTLMVDICVLCRDMERKKIISI